MILTMFIADVNVTNIQRNMTPVAACFIWKKKKKSGILFYSHSHVVSFITFLSLYCTVCQLKEEADTPPPSNPQLVVSLCKNTE